MLPYTVHCLGDIVCKKYCTVYVPLFRIRIMHTSPIRLAPGSGSIYGAKPAQMEKL
jgi:hypothetical protein